MLDLLVIGGGINGTGIAADAAGRGLSVILCEQGDLSCGTSSKSSKLIHGGLRYLEQYEFRLVREALSEREILLKKAPHLIAPLQFILPHDSHLKPAWMLRIGLFLYDHLGKRSKLPRSESIKFSDDPAGVILKSDYDRGFSYSDCWVDDSRLVVLNAIAARDLGANILTRTRFISAQRYEKNWQVMLEDANKNQQCFAVKAIVNAAGPWVDEIINGQLKLKSQYHLSLVKGSHIVVPKLYSEDFAFILINPDNRVVFVIPFHDQFSLIGTTDVPFSGDPMVAEIDVSEVNYLCQAVNRYFKKALCPQDVVWSYAGVRALHQEDSKSLSTLSRDYVLELNSELGSAPVMNVFGGKITTYRTLAEHVLADLKPFFPKMGSSWTRDVPLPGGDIPCANFFEFYEQFQQQYSWLPPSLSYRYARNYGTLAHVLLRNILAMDDLGKHYGAGLYEQEVEYLIRFEWAKTAEDILWRRTKLGLFMNVDEQLQLKNKMELTAFGS